MNTWFLGEICLILPGSIKGVDGSCTICLLKGAAEIKLPRDARVGGNWKDNTPTAVLVVEQCLKRRGLNVLQVYF